MEGARNQSYRMGSAHGFILTSYLSPALPKFLYFDDYKILDGKINLATLKQREESEHLTDADETALGLLDLAGTTLEELSSEEGYETSRQSSKQLG